jgi:hypothetical protein
MGNGQVGGYAMGNMAVFSTDDGVNGYWMMHEFNGHAFGGLPDLYYVWGENRINQSDRRMFDENHENGELLMYDWRSDPNEVFWKDFIGQPCYEMVGVYPGGYAYWNRMIKFGDCFVPEEYTACVMNGPVPHYSVMERYQIWRKIQQRAGLTGRTIDEFKEYDKVNIGVTLTWEDIDN